jgi:hypothetical protein
MLDLAELEAGLRMLPNTDFVLRVAANTLARSKLGTISGEVWCQLGEEGFPQVGWSDIAAAVVSWWLESTVRLVDGRKRNAVMRFMDGPFEVRVFAKRRDLWQADLVDEHPPVKIRQVEFMPDQFLRSLIASSGEVVEQCLKNGWKSNDVDSIILHRERLIHYAAKNRGLL